MKRPLIALLIVATITACNKKTTTENAPATVVTDTLDNTIWTGYYSNGVGIIRFNNGIYSERFYDAITTKSEEEVHNYLVDDSMIKIINGEGDTTRMYFGLAGDAGETLNIYKDSADFTENRPNITLKKLR